MDIKKIGNRGVYFTFSEGDSPMGYDTSVYLINCEDKLFLCDTHLGTKSMEVVIDYIRNNNLSSKEIIVFNSHSDYDHIWGNCSFPNSTIISHELCYLKMKEKGQYDLEKYSQAINGHAEIILPNLTFASKLTYSKDGIEFKYLPGHTVCSAICFDKIDSVLFVGDLVEAPNPYLNHYDIDGFINSLEYIKNHPAKIKVSSHSGIVDNELIIENIKYLKNLTTDDDSLKLPLLLKYEDILRNKLKGNFNLKEFRTNFWMSISKEYTNLAKESKYLQNINYNDLEKALIHYIEKN